MPRDASREEERDLQEVVEVLADTARQLSKVAEKLAAQAGEGPADSQQLTRSAEILEELSDRLAAYGKEGRSTESAVERERLRQEILRVLKRGPTLPIELAAATLSFVEDIQPIVEELEGEGLVVVRHAGEAGRMIALTPLGRQQARSLLRG